MESAWATTTGSNTTVIAVLDTGVKADGTYPDLNGKVLPGWDFIDNDSNADDENDGYFDPNEIGHGTMVSLIAAGLGDDGFGMAGYCWQCRILPVRVLDETGAGDMDTVAQGINWAVANGADLINLSLTGPEPSDDVRTAVANAQSAGVAIVAAAGNQSFLTPDVNKPLYPAALSGVISVGASNTSDSLYSWSFRGASWVQVAAPGCIFGEEECGTSFASPAVAGIIGLGMSVDPAATDDSLKNALYTSVKPISGVAHGRVDAVQFLTMLADDVEATRVAGATRVDTAIALSQRAYPSGATDVILARSDNYADALAAAPLAGAHGAPVLLTPSSALPGVVKDEINRLGATTAWLVGGTSAISPSVESSVLTTSVDTTHRIFGDDRYGTAGEIGKEVDTTVNASTVYVASAKGFADAVAVSNLAAREKAPILLVTKDVVPTATLEAIEAIAPTTNIVIVGGVNVVSEGVRSTLASETGITVTRVGGTDRYDTSRLLALRAVGAGLDEKKVWVATGLNWPDALAAGPGAAAAGAVLLLTHPLAAPTVNDWLDGVTATEVLVAGGVSSVRDTTMYSMQAHLD
jgi:cell wall-associated protease